MANPRYRHELSRRHLLRGATTLAMTALVAACGQEPATPPIASSPIGGSGDRSAVLPERRHADRGDQPHRCRDRHGGDPQIVTQPREAYKEFIATIDRDGWDPTGKTKKYWFRACLTNPNPLRNHGAGGFYRQYVRRHSQFMQPLYGPIEDPNRFVRHALVVSSGTA